MQWPLRSCVAWDFSQMYGGVKGTAAQTIGQFLVGHALWTSSGTAVRDKLHDVTQNLGLL